MNNSLLISEPPLQVLPSLACKVGLNEAIVLQQFHYWLQHSNNIKDGHKWIYNSYSEWHKQFPFWSEITLKRAILSLEKKGYLIVGNYNKAGFDKTKWYRIDYSKLMIQPSYQNDTTSVSKCTDGMYQNDPTNTNRLPETTSENTTEDILSSSHSTVSHSADCKMIVSYLNQKAGTNYRSTSKKTQRLINARFNDGATVDDFKKVIDIKVIQWKNDDKMSKYLRPETLFGSKFEGYLNEQANKKPNSKKIDGIDWKVDW